MLYLICYIVPKNVQKFTLVLNILASFVFGLCIVIHCTFQIPGDVTKLREDYIKKCKELKLTIQPYVIVVGPTLHEISTSYVCIDDVLYNTSSTLEAIDVCFKTFHVLQLQYPTASEHLWFIIQKCLYNFVTKWDIIIPSTEHIIKILHEKNQSCANTSDSTE